MNNAAGFILRSSHRRRMFKWISTNSDLFECLLFLKSSTVFCAPHGQHAPTASIAFLCAMREISKPQNFPMLDLWTWLIPCSHSAVCGGHCERCSRRCEGLGLPYTNTCTTGHMRVRSIKETQKERSKGRIAHSRAPITSRPLTMANVIACKYPSPFVFAGKLVTVQTSPF